MKHPENVSALEIQGINRNQTKLGSPDGSMHDLINLRFKDGSWRTSGDGKRVTSFTECASGREYSQLYVHTGNKYKHVLGVRDGGLWWFANIDNNGQNFSPVVPAERLTDIKGNMYINQTGHLITVIDGEDNFEYFVFKIDDDRYKQVKVDENGPQSSREMFPFGRAHFNLWSPMNAEHTFADDRDKDGNTLPNYKDFWQAGLDMDEGAMNDAGIGDQHPETYQNLMVSTWAKATKANQFTNPFLACVAVELYDGTWVYASNPVLLFPHDSLARQYVCYKKTGTHVIPKRQSIGYLNAEPGTIEWAYNGDSYKDDKIQNAHYQFIEGNKGGFVRHGMVFLHKTGSVKFEDGTYPSENDGYESQRYLYTNAPVWIERGSDVPIVSHGYFNTTSVDTRMAKLVRITDMPVMCCGGSSRAVGLLQGGLSQTQGTQPECYVFGSDLTLSLTNTNFLEENSDIFKSIGVFITKPADLFNMEADNKEGIVKFAFDVDVPTNYYNRIVNVAYIPKRHTDEEIIYDLMHSPFYLLRKYTKESIRQLEKDPRVQLTEVKYKEILKNITQQPTLEIESLSRISYLPKVVYSYNDRLHIANYKSVQFHGYPLDAFQLHNHLVYKKAGAVFKNTLPNLLRDTDEAHRQFAKGDVYFMTYSNNANFIDAFIAKLKEKNKAFAFVTVKLDTEDGEQVVTRYISPYKTFPTPEIGEPNYIESLNPLLTFPDARAKEMQIVVINVHQDEVKWYSRTFPLQASEVMNMAYYFNGNLQPINLNDNAYWHEVQRHGPTEGGDILAFIEDRIDIDIPDIPEEQENIEYYSHGLKVSRTNNPFYFPAQNTYSAGRSAILAMVSNTIAVGTGQTGAAPLYVFCQDGVYALFVDANGEMAYTNSRILTRDVLSVPKSVTPMDSGVVFITERGLMSIAGEEAIKLSQPCEGDVEVISEPEEETWDTAKKFTFQRATSMKLGALPTDMFDGVDFLTYLNDTRNGEETLINYNHNERELMVSNPNYPYSYIMDVKGNWSRRDYTADQYLNNFPTSYRIKDGVFFKVDDEGDLREESAAAVHVNKSAASNGFFAVSNPIMLDSIGFKQAHRFVVRGEFETDTIKRVIDSEYTNNYQPLGQTPILKTINLPATIDGSEWSGEDIPLIDPIYFTIPENSWLTETERDGSNSHYAFNGKITVSLADNDCAFRGYVGRERRFQNLNVRMAITNLDTGNLVFSKVFSDLDISDDAKTATLNLSAAGNWPVDNALPSGNYSISLEILNVYLRQVYTKDEEEITILINDTIPAINFGETEIVEEDNTLVKEYQITESNPLGIVLLSREFVYHEADNVTGKISGKLRFVPIVNGEVEDAVFDTTKASYSTMTYRLVLSKYDSIQQQYISEFDVQVPMQMDLISPHELIVDFDDYIDFGLGNQKISDVLNLQLALTRFTEGFTYKFELIHEDSNLYVKLEDSYSYQPNSIIEILATGESDASLSIISDKTHTPNYQFIIDTSLGDVNDNEVVKLGFRVEEFYAQLYTEQHVENEVTKLGCYVLGSYDGRKWALLGGNERAGHFTDIGCLVERADVKFFRVVLAGNLKGKSRVDYMEISTRPSKLNTKIR